MYIFFINLDGEFHLYNTKHTFLSILLYLGFPGLTFFTPYLGFSLCLVIAFIVTYIIIVTLKLCIINVFLVLPKVCIIRYKQVFIVLDKSF